MAGVPAPLQGIPNDIEYHRRMMFSLEQPVHLTPAVFNTYFPFIDNVWTFSDPKGTLWHGGSVIKGKCRLLRKPVGGQGSNTRSRSQRDGTGTCNARFKITILHNGVRVLEKLDDTTHSHDLEFIDSVKRNSGVRSIILHDFFKSWDVSAVLAYLRDNAHNVNGKDLLKEAGGHYINRNEVSNIINRALRTAYPGQDVTEIKRQQEKYKAYKTCSYKGCIAAPFPTAKELAAHIRDAHGVKKRDHTKKIPCPDPTCSRRKPSRGFTSAYTLAAHQQRYHGAQSAGLIDHAMGPRTLATGQRASDAADDEEAEDPGEESEIVSDAISSPARRHMEDRLAQMVKDRKRLDADIQALRERLYGGEGSPGDDLAAAQLATAADSEAS